MSFDSLLNKVCEWKRKRATASSAFGEQNITFDNIGESVACRLDPISKTELEDVGIIGQTGKAYERLFLKGRPDIVIGDIVEVTGEVGLRTVRVPQNAGGQDHHTEVILELTEIR